MQQFLVDSAEEAPQPVNRVLMDSDTEVPVEEEVAERSSQDSVSPEDFEQPQAQDEPEPDTAPVEDVSPPEPYQPEDEPDPPIPESVETEEFTEPEVMELPETRDGFAGLQFEGFELPDMQSDFVREAAEFTADTIVQREAMMRMQFQDELNEALGLMERRSAF